MRAEMNLKALKIAIKNIGKDYKIGIHHSDRADQYGIKIYTNELNKME